MAVDTTRRRPRNDNWKAAGCLGGVAIVFGMAWGSVELIKTLLLLKRGTTTEALITRLETGQEDNEATIPVFSFETDRDLVEVKSMVGSRGYRVGDTVAVIYDPNNPHIARIRNFTDMWFRTVLPFAVAAVFAAILAVFRWTQ